MSSRPTYKNIWERPRKYVAGGAIKYLLIDNTRSTRDCIISIYFKIDSISFYILNLEGYIL
uniref:Uncharacterized protein n=1 Tax=Heterorhabditis bacteriophora TaxID=37862 RepID=A0A1I7WY83_HETBA